MTIFQQILKVELGSIIHGAGFTSCSISKSNLMDVPNKLILFSRSPNLIRTKTAPLIRAIALVHSIFTLSFLPVSLKSYITILSSSESWTSEAFESPLEYAMSLRASSSASDFLKQLRHCRHHTAYFNASYSSCYYSSLALVDLPYSYTFFRKARFS